MFVRTCFTREENTVNLPLIDKKPATLWLIPYPWLVLGDVSDLYPMPMKLNLMILVLNHPPIILLRIDQNLPFSAVTCQDFLR